jgi:hypothetical protein
MKKSMKTDALLRLDTDYSPTHPPPSSRTGFILIHSPLPPIIGLIQHLIRHNSDSTRLQIEYHPAIR